MGQGACSCQQGLPRFDNCPSESRDIREDGPSGDTSRQEIQIAQGTQERLPCCPRLSGQGEGVCFRPRAAATKIRNACSADASGSGNAGLSSDDDDDGNDPPDVSAFGRSRCGGVIATPPDPSFISPLYSVDDDLENDIRNALKTCPLFCDFGEDDFETVLGAVEVSKLHAGQRLIEQGEYANALFLVLQGTVLFQEDLLPVSSGFQWAARSYERRYRRHGSTMLIGEVALLWNAPSKQSVYARGDCVIGRLHGDVYRSTVVQNSFKAREKREACLRQVLALDTLGDEQIVQLTDVMKETVYADGDSIIQQGEEGDEIFVVQSGECVATVQTFDDVQEVNRYGPGDLFGELAFVRRAPRAATVKSAGNSLIMTLDRATFERMLGPLTLLRERQYINDPRKLIAEGYRAGDRHGPLGSAERLHVPPGSPPVTKWFAVFRPTSRDAIAKMLSGDAVGKSMNVKGKSAKKSRLSGYVPFVQISKNCHKKFVNECKPKDRLKIFFTTERDCDAVLAALMKETEKEGEHLACVEASPANWELKETKILRIDDYAPDVYGLDVPASAVRDVYIMKADLSLKREWDTGRPSEPAYMNMNLKAASADSEPEVVLYQFDHSDPLNPRGLLIAYAEDRVKPVVSDFDALLVASKGMTYERLPPKQQKLMLWTIDRVEEILKKPTTESWTSRWLEVLRSMRDEGEHPVMPKYGFGDPTSYRLIGDIIAQTAPSGAVRHGPECFNFYFPQELDDEFLVVWEEFPDKPWVYMSESDLKNFLHARIQEGFSFPLNPVWPLRDQGWYAILQGLRNNAEARAATIDSWYPPESGILQRIDEIHQEFSMGFRKLPAGSEDIYMATTEAEGFRSEGERHPDSLQDLYDCMLQVPLKNLRKSARKASLRSYLTLLDSLGRMGSGSKEPPPTAGTGSPPSPPSPPDNKKPAFLRSLIRVPSKNSAMSGFSAVSSMSREDSNDSGGHTTPASPTSPQKKSIRSLVKTSVVSFSSNDSNESLAADFR